MSGNLRRNTRAHLGAAIVVTATVTLMYPAACQAGHPAGAAKPPSVQMSAAKMPEFHYTPPKMPHFSQAQLANIPQPGMDFVPFPMNSGPVKPPLGTSLPSKASNALSSQAVIGGSTSKVKPSQPGTSSAPPIATAAVAGSGRYYGGGRRYYGGGGYWRRATYRPMNQLNGPMRRLQKLIADLDTLSPGTQVNQVHKNMLRYDLMAVSEGLPKPTSVPVQQLANDLAEGLIHRSVPVLNTMELAGDLKAVMNTAHLARVDVNTAMNEGAILMKGSGVQQAHVQAITTDLKAVLASVPVNQALGQVR